VAHYRVAFSLIRYYRQLMQALFGVLLPAFSLQDGAGDKQGLERTFFISLRLSVGVSSFVAFALIAWGAPFIERWVGAAYLDAYPCLVALALGSLFGLWQSTLPTVLLSSGRERLVAALAVIEGIANVVVSVVLVQWYGMLGVALGTLIPSAVIRLGIQPVLGAQAMGMPVWRYVGELVRSIGASALALAPGALLTWRFATPDYFVLASLAAVTGLAYAPAFFWFGLRRDDRRAILNAFGPKGRKRARRATLEDAADPSGEGHV
jgi:O-antigen/teichoic acid export membrane protein